MTWTGNTMAAVMPQISAAHQPPRSSTENPSEPSKEPGFARQITNPSYQRSVFRSWRSSTIASATFPPHSRQYKAPPRQYPGRAVEGNTSPGHFQRRPSRSGRTAAYNRFGLHRPPITISCECGEKREVAYGDRWHCETCGRSWNTNQIPAEEYEGLLRRMRRHQFEALAAMALAAAIMIPLIVFVSSRFILLVLPLMAVWLVVLLPYWRRRYRRAAGGAPPPPPPSR